MTIGEYNTQFSSFKYLVEDVEANHIEKYVDGLNTQIIHKAMSKEWFSVSTLAKKMEMGSEAAAKIDILAVLPSVLSSVNPHALSTNCPPGIYPPHHSQFPLVADPDAMDIDATSAQTLSNTSLLFESSRSICRACKLCFRCLKFSQAFTLGVLTSLNLPSPWNNNICSWRGIIASQLQLTFQPLIFLLRLLKPRPVGVSKGKCFY